MELVAIGLHRRSLDELCAGRRSATSAAPPIDQAYLLKVLDEEVGRQFGHPMRPIVELVLNAADAMIGHTPRGVVEITATPGRVEVADSGSGMTLRSILSRLLVPFATDKRPGVEIGRFGVGFFSVLGYAAADPRGFSLDVETGDDREGWALEVRADDPRTSSLRCVIRRRPAATGTRVVVVAPSLEPEGVRSYLREMLHFFPEERALLRMDGAPLNDDAAIAERVFHDLASPGPPPIVGRFFIGERACPTTLPAATYHCGVKVESCNAISAPSLIDFPGAVELTEGRDSLKPGPELDAVAAAYYRRLIRIAEDARAGRAARDQLCEIAAQVSSMLLSSAAWSEAAPELGRALLGEGRFLVSADRAEPILGFLGSSVAPSLFVPESFWAEREWQYFLPNEQDLLERELDLDPPETLAALAVRRLDLAGLVYVVARVPDPAAITVRLARGKRAPAGPMPCLDTRRALLIREDAAAVRAVRSWAQLYALRAAFARASGLREADVERDIILDDPAGSRRRAGALS